MTAQSARSDRFDSFHAKLLAFVAERDWAKFHNPKNLAMALVAEAGELVEHFQWLTPEQADALNAQAREEVAMEIADVLIYLVELADRLGIDPIEAAERKLARNAVRYPVEKSRGVSTKYDKL
jgi:dCTP diphosphatase